MARPGMNTMFRWLAIGILALTLVQPVAGPLAFFDPAASIDWEKIHQLISELLRFFLLILAVTAFFTTFRLRWWLLGLSAVTWVIANIQIAIGYAARDNAKLFSAHIPIGVAIILLMIVIVLLTLGVRFGRSDA